MNNTAASAKGALGTLVTVFFFWGFIAAGNNIFIPFCKHYFHLDQFQSQLIDFAFYLAYYLGALGLFLYSGWFGFDQVTKWGYKKSIVFGLLFSALGAIAMILAVGGNSFSGMLLGLFIVALGFSLQQTAAQPLAISLGDPLTGASRVNLGGGVNSLGTTLGPLVVALALFGSAAAVGDDQIRNLPLTKVVILYAIVGGLFIMAAALFGFSKKVPAGISSDSVEKAPKARMVLLLMTLLLVLFFIPVFSSYRSEEAIPLAQLQERSAALKASDFSSATLFSEAKDSIDSSIQIVRGPLEQKRMLWLGAALSSILLVLAGSGMAAKNKPDGWGAMKFPQLILGMLAIFVYVGVEVAMGSNLAELLKNPDFGAYSSSQTAPFIAMFWGSLMVGRWTGAVAALGLSRKMHKVLLLLVPFLALGVVLLATHLAGHDVNPLRWYFLCVILQVFAAWISKDNPARTLLVFGVLGMASLAFSLFAKGLPAVYAVLCGGLACSIMWPAIFTLALAGLGKYTSQGSAFLVMMILGGAILPPIQGKLADLIGIQNSYVLAVLCFAFLTWYAVRVRQILISQGIDIDAVNSQTGH